MNINEITSLGKRIDEAPVGLLKQLGRKIGAKAAGAIGMKGTAAKLGGAAEVGDEARQLKVALQGYAGKTGIDLKQMQGPQLAAFLKSKGYPNMHLKAVQGIMTPKQIDAAIMTAAQDAAKAGGDTSVGTSTAPAATGGASRQGGTAGTPRASGQPAATTTQAPAAQPAAATGSQPQAAAPSTAQGVPPALLKKLSQLKPNEKKQLVGML